jgi:hypothetical protein
MNANQEKLAESFAALVREILFWDFSENERYALERAYAKKGEPQIKAAIKESVGAFFECLRAEIGSEK